MRRLFLEHRGALWRRARFFVLSPQQPSDLNHTAQVAKMKQSTPCHAMPETPDGRVALPRCGGQRQGMAGEMTMIENLGLAFRVAHTAGEGGHSVVSSRASVFLKNFVAPKSSRRVV